jgi:hypothetical protein
MAAIETGLDVAVLEHTTFTSGTVTGLIYKGLSRRVSKASVSDRTLTLNIEYSTFPNWIRTEQGVWKHGLHRAPVDCTPLLWCIVFPVGMYAVASLRLSRVANMPELRLWSWTVAWIALTVWGATAIALIVTSFQSIRTFIGASTMVEQRERM